MYMFMRNIFVHYFATKCMLNDISLSNMIKIKRVPTAEPSSIEEILRVW